MDNDQGGGRPADDCPLHHGPGNRLARQRYDPIMRSLPRNQLGEGLARHACAICAYERGREDMMKQIAKWLEVPLDEMPDSNSLDDRP